jgi:hypothetical protein
VWNASSKVSSTLSCTEAPARSTVGIEISLWIVRWGSLDREPGPN